MNNAGILSLLPIEWTPLSIYKSTADVNLWGMIDVTKTFLPLIKRAQGRVVNFSSAAGKLTKLRNQKTGLCNLWPLEQLQVLSYAKLHKNHVITC